MMERQQKCEWEGCDELADGFVEAQWTIVDFMRFESCVAHLFDFGDALRNYYVDGVPARPYVTLYD